MGRAVPAQLGGLCPWECTQAGRETSKDKPSLEKHRVSCADLLVPLWSFMHSMWQQRVMLWGTTSTGGNLSISRGECDMGCDNGLSSCLGV